MDSVPGDTLREQLSQQSEAAAAVRRGMGPESDPRRKAISLSFEAFGLTRADNQDRKSEVQSSRERQDVTGIN